MDLKVLFYGENVLELNYKKAINSYGEKRYKFYMIIYEDSIINYIIHQYAKTSNFIIKYGILIIKRLRSASRVLNNLQRNIFFMKYIETLLEYSKNSIEAKEIVVINIKKIIKKNYFEKLLKNEYLEKILDYYYIKKIIFSNFILRQKYFFTDYFVIKIIIMKI